MNDLQKYRQQLRMHLLFVVVAENIFVLGLFWAIQHAFQISNLLALLFAITLTFIASTFIVTLITTFLTEPTKALWQAIMYLNPDEHGTPAPKPEELSVGRELVANLIGQIYQLSSTVEKTKTETKQQSHNLHQNFIAQNLPLPLIVLDPSQTIIYANEATASYLGSHVEDLLGKNVYMVMDMSFPSEDTFDSWLKTAVAKNATATSSWERVRLNVRDGHPELLFDLAAYYNRDNPDKQETILVLFDHTKQYSQDDQAVSFIALSVHELRTPLTLLRGYIEVFEEELGDNISPELQGFMLKMRAMSEQLTAFVNNILNVARVDDDQLELRLQSEDWSSVLKSAVEMISLRAKVRDITLNCHIAKDLPAVGIDRLSIREVINNLVDNAIKYSGKSKTIEINSFLNKEGLVETTVQDFGVGVPSSVVPNLFTKFYRDHRNRAQIGGTGLGLYLSKAIVAAHGGTIWLRSKEGEGSTFGFTVLPYERLTEGQKHGGEDITRSAHGWIKNHSLYRR